MITSPDENYLTRIIFLKEMQNTATVKYFMSKSKSYRHFDVFNFYNVIYFVLHVILLSEGQIEIKARENSAAKIDLI